MAQDPGRVFPGKKMTGHLGDVNRTTQNLLIVRIDAERQLLLIRGAIPGAKNGDIMVHPAVKPAKTPVKPAAKPAAKAGK
jgi:large subunit ribosomal protein L3